MPKKEPQEKPISVILDRETRFSLSVKGRAIYGSDIQGRPRNPQWYCRQYVRRLVCADLGLPDPTPTAEEMQRRRKLKNQRTYARAKARAKAAEV